MTGSLGPVPGSGLSEGEYLQFQAGVQALLAGALGASGLTVESATRYLDGFSWETWHVVVAVAAGDTRQYVVRRVPRSGLLDTYDVEQQWHLHRAIAGIPGVPAPKALLVDADGAATGRPLFLMEYVPGAVPTPQTMNALVPYRADRISLIHQLATIAAAIHSAPVSHLPADLRGRAASGLTAEVDYWARTYRRNRRAPIPILDWAFGWLRRNEGRVSGRAALVHGDLRVGNFIVGRQNIIAAVLDWEGAHVGDPVEDLANCCMRLHGGGPDTVSGVIGVQEFLRAYEQAAGWSVPHATFNYWRIFCDVRSAIVFITAARRFEDGRTDDLRYAVLGQQLPILLEHVVKDLSSIVGEMRLSA